MDLVQFPKPVYITEVRIIPLGSRVQADFPGGVRLGATNPSKFHIEFFVNDLGKPGASTFECLGNFDYNQNDCINLECDHLEDNVRQIPTDGLVLRGWYTTITLAVYGKLTKAIPEPITSPPTERVQHIAIAPKSVEPVQVPIDAKHVIEICTPYEVPPYPDTFEVQPYLQPAVYYSGLSPKDGRLLREHNRAVSTLSATAHRSASSESDWDRDEEEKSARQQVDSSAVFPNAPHPSSVEVSRTRDTINREYSRSSSRETDYHSGKRERSRSPEYLHSRRTRTLSYDRGSNKREKSPNYNIILEKRPRTPPVLSPRRPHTPERVSSTLGTSPPKCIKNDPHEKRNYEKGQSIRVIDLLTEDRIKISPNAECSSQTTHEMQVDSPIPADDDNISHSGEPFEPILSDEEIGDETEIQCELD